MRILMLAQNFAPIVGGEERMVEDLSLELGERGHRVAVAMIRQADHDPCKTRDGVRIYGLRSLFYRATGRNGGANRPQAPPAPDPRAVLDLRNVLRRERPEVVHAHNWLVHSYLPLHSGSGAALVLSLHDYGLVCATKRLLRRGVQCSGPGPVKCVDCASHYYPGVKGPAVAVGTLVRGPVLRRCVDLFLPVSAAVRDRCGVGPGDPHRVIPNFVRRRPAHSIEDPRLALLPQEPFVLFLGDVTVDKGARHLADVYRTLDRPPPLVFIGRCFIDDLAQHPGIAILGPWPHELAQEAVRRAMFTVMPTIMAEAFGLAALESAAAGKAVVASNVGGLPEIVIHGETGLLVAPGDTGALRAALGRLIADARLRAQMGEAAARRARSFDAQAIVPAFEDAYHTAIDLHRRRNDKPRAASDTC
jgi:glycosyltransferase involved in cell wall biosynthesis